ncbi:MAG TPA: transcription antitermination factor NusB [Streptosporangiales bacterium]
MSRPVDTAREVAFETLRAVDGRDAYANLVLPRALRTAGLGGRDAALATELSYGTLRRRGTYDAVLAACVDRPFEAVDPPLRDVLRLGAHQLLSMRVPRHAAVSTSVTLARARLGRGPAGLVNAVLRRVGGRDLPAWVDAVAPSRADDPAGHLAVAHAHPRWIVEAFHAALDGSWEQTEAALAADNEPAEVVLCARPGLCPPEELGGRPGRWSPYARVVGGDPGELAAVRAARAGVQDEGSQLVTLALAGAPLGDGVPDDAWLETCAGPGGKAALLGALAASRDARLVAGERRHRRARLVAGALAPLDNAVALTADGTAGPWRDASFARVLVDAPCTGLGALRRRPEARWRRSADDVPGLAALQQRLLRAALAAARPGGVVAYVTCSPHPAETRDVVRTVVGDTQDAELLDARSLLTGVPGPGPGPWVQLWPHRHGTDAMFLALLRRTTS